MHKQGRNHRIRSRTGRTSKIVQAQWGTTPNENLVILHRRKSDGMTPKYGITLQAAPQQRKCYPNMPLEEITI
jgi:hypothetical protein